MKPVNEIPDPKNEKAFNIVELAVERFKKDKPFIIGITGAGGAGKTTFGNNIAQYYGQNNCVSIDLDDYLISREERGKLELTGYNPRANKLFLARQNIENLISRKATIKPIY
jgi:uridine kinase